MKWGSTAAAHTTKKMIQSKISEDILHIKNKTVQNSTEKQAKYLQFISQKGISM